MMNGQRKSERELGVRSDKKSFAERGQTDQLIKKLSNK